MQNVNQLNHRHHHCSEELRTGTHSDDNLFGGNRSGSSTKATEIFGIGPNRGWVGGGQQRQRDISHHRLTLGRSTHDAVGAGTKDEVRFRAHWFHHNSGCLFVGARLTRDGNGGALEFNNLDGEGATGGGDGARAHRNLLLLFYSSNSDGGLGGGHWNCDDGDVFVDGDVAGKGDVVIKDRRVYRGREVEVGGKGGRAWLLLLLLLLLGGRWWRGDGRRRSVATDAGWQCCGLVSSTTKDGWCERGARGGAFVALHQATERVVVGMMAIYVRHEVVREVSEHWMGVNRVFRGSNGQTNGITFGKGCSVTRTEEDGKEKEKREIGGFHHGDGHGDTVYYLSIIEE